MTTVGTDWPYRFRATDLTSDPGQGHGYGLSAVAPQTNGQINGENGPINYGLQIPQEDGNFVAPSDNLPEYHNCKILSPVDPFGQAYGLIGANPPGIEEQRAKDVALDLPMLGLNSGTPPNQESLNTFIDWVSLPSATHIAEVVGRRGWRVKDMRERTHTYISTPAQWEEHIFTIIGTKENIAAARREILGISEDVSMRLAREAESKILARTEGTITIPVRVEHSVVGLVTGTKGATIKRIQMETNTFILSPSRDGEPVFQVTGFPDDVKNAKQKIDAHVNSFRRYRIAKQ